MIREEWAVRPQRESFAKRFPYLAKWLWGNRARRCHWCNIPLTRKTRTFYHLLEKARGGNDLPENIVLACRPCNSSRSNRIRYGYPSRP